MKNVSYTRTLSLLVFLLIGFASSAFAQSLYEPLDIQSAYQKETRSRTGAPGENYFQNYTDYKIDASFDPAARTISGSLTALYHNQSPDTLKEIRIYLYQNLFKKGNARDFTIAPEDVTGGIVFTEITINFEAVPIDPDLSDFTRSGTVGALELKQPLAPSQTLSLGFKWSLQLPQKSNIRMGSYADSAFFAAYWYPEIAVYDDIDGWDRTQYTGLQEFYHDFNTYDVSITVPANFVVWASGELQNPSEVFMPKYVSRLQQAAVSDTIFSVISSKDYLLRDFITQQKDNTFRFTAKNTPDFAFAACDKYLWDGVSLVVDSTTNRRVFISAAYHPDAVEYPYVCETARNSIAYLSHEMPGVPYPYPQMTVFQGGGGMEFPMMVNDGDTQTRTSTVHLTSHEISHTYFPFYTGINERKYAWMDEGMATMLPMDFQERFGENYDPMAKNIASYSEYMGMEMDMAPMVPSVNLTSPSYRNASYRRPGIAFEMLHNYLGTDLYRKALQTFIFRWNGKHPIPFDLFYTFNEVTGKDLSWFFIPWFFERGYAELSIVVSKKTDSELEFTVSKTGLFPVPIYAEIVYQDGTTQVFEAKADIWIRNPATVTFTFPNKPAVKVTLGSPHIPDAIPSNNVILF